MTGHRQTRDASLERPAGAMLVTVSYQSGVKAEKNDNLFLKLGINQNGEIPYYLAKLILLLDS